MSVVAIISALVIEQWRPVGERYGVQAALAAWASWLERSFNGGERQHGVTAWLVGILPPVVLAIVLHALFSAAGWLAALLFDIAVLYLTLGFRQFSHYFTDIQVAIKAGDVDRARALLEEWRGASGVVRTREEVVRLSIEEALVAAHRHVFGVLFWYLILPGPSGAILYRLAAYLAGRWRPLGAFGQFPCAVLTQVKPLARGSVAHARPPASTSERRVVCWTGAPWGRATAMVAVAGFGKNGNAGLWRRDHRPIAAAVAAHLLPPRCITFPLPGDYPGLPLFSSADETPAAKSNLAPKHNSLRSARIR